MTKTKTRKEIAQELGCSTKTLNNWLRPIANRLGISRYQHTFTPKQVTAIYEFLVINKEEI